MADETPYQEKSMDENSIEHNEKYVKEDREREVVLNQVTDTNKRLDDIYDEKFRKIDSQKKMAKLGEDKTDEQKLNEQVLQEKYLGLKTRLSALRKIGKDPIIADFKSRAITSKIMIFKVTQEKKDFDDAENLIKDCVLECEEAERQENLDVKKEIEKKLQEEMLEARSTTNENQEASSKN